MSRHITSAFLATALLAVALTAPPAPFDHRTAPAVAATASQAAQTVHLGTVSKTQQQGHKAKAKTKTTTIKGKVVDSHGKPVRKGFVEVWKNPPKRVPYTQVIDRTDLFVKAVPISSKGTYKVTGLSAKTNYRIMAAAEGHLTTWLSGVASNWPVGSRGIIKTGKAGSTATAKTVKLVAGGVTLKGKIAAAKRDSELEAFATDLLGTRLTGSLAGQGAAADVKRFNHYVEDPFGSNTYFTGFVFKDGSYLVPGVPPAITILTVANTFGKRSKVLAEDKPKIVTTNFAALPRTTVYDKAESSAVALYGYYAPGYNIRAEVVPASGSTSAPANADVYWTDGTNLLGSGKLIGVTESMIGKQVFPLVHWTANGHDLGVTEYGRVDSDWVPTIAQVPIGRRLVAPAKIYVGDTISAGMSPPGWTNTYQWYRGTQAIEGATSSSYRAQAEDVGSLLLVRIGAMSSDGRYGEVVVRSPRTEVFQRHGE
ncbi:MAG: hypothetical protein LBG70_05115 [Bifidobacteriaceae bacterium]|jgi:hypothetical protein|nr:hypothetical protein [Bifidobacteriaceae bacterium]